MGDIINITCSTCGYDLVFYVGNGFLDHHIDHILCNFSKKEARNIRLWLKNNQLKSFKYNKFLSLCKTCLNYKAIPVLILISDDGEQMVFGLHCDRCHDLLEFIDPYSEEQHTCKNCGGEVDFKNVGTWD